MRHVAVVLIVLAGACASPPSRALLPAVAPAEASARVDLEHASCARRRVGLLPERPADVRQGNAVALVSVGDRVLAYVADADSRSIHTVSLDDARELWRRTRLLARRRASCSSSRTGASS